MHFPHRLAAIALLLFASATAQAATVGEVRVRGLDEAMTRNVRLALSLVDARGRELSARRLAYLLREAEDEARQALQPFGYYSPQIEVTRSETASGGPVTVTLTIDAGQPVRVRESHVAIRGEGGSDRYLREDLAEFEPETGEVFAHPVYEASKRRISRRLSERGYFDAEFASRRVAVTRAEHAADIDLVWDSGARYDMGAVDFTQTPDPIIREGLLRKLVYWEQGSYYHQGKLDRLRESLAELDYFASVDIEPLPEQAEDHDVPVQVTLTPAKRSVYTAGLSYGTDSGAGIRLGLERRYVNDRGHKFMTQLNYAQRRKTLTAQYRIPAFAWLDGWYTLSAQAADEQTDYIDSRRVEFVASRSGEINRRWTAIASLHTLRERWAYATEDDGDESTPVDYRYATLTYPSLRGEYVNADNLVFPRDAISISIALRGGVEGVGSDASFAQVHTTAHWYQGVGASNRLIVRGEIGHTYTDALVDMPPSLRFFAGGNDSIRGYAWREVGPRIVTEEGEFALGAKNVTTASVEFEHYFNDTWGVAVFADTGTAFNTDPDWHTGVGIGLRWRSPVGPLRVDIARGLDNPDSPFQLYLNIGADL